MLIMDNSLTEKLKNIDKELRKNLSDEKSNNRIFMNHYTSPEGLKGILSSGQLWFSNAKFLNDKTETTYLYSILPITPDPYDLVLDEKFFKYIRNIADSFLKDDACDIDDICISPTDFYVASFSQDEDNLELWNYYTKTSDSIGYNISFYQSAFTREEENNNYYKFIKGKVIYKLKEQQKLIRNILNQYNDFYTNFREEIESNEINKLNFLKQLINILELHNMFFKHSAFENEKEFRCVIYYIKDYERTPYDFRIVNGIFLPYLKINFEKINVNSITISPANDQQILKDSLEFYTKLKGYPNVHLHTSKIPKRY